MWVSRYHSFGYCRDFDAQQKPEPLGLQVYKYCLLWALKYISMTYVGLFGAPGERFQHARHKRKYLKPFYQISVTCINSTTRFLGRPTRTNLPKGSKCISLVRIKLKHPEHIITGHNQKGTTLQPLGTLGALRNASDRRSSDSLSDFKLLSSNLRTQQLLPTAKVLAIWVFCPNP